MAQKKKKGGGCGKLFLTAFLTVIMALSFVVPSHAALQDMWAYVYKWTGGMDADGKMALTRLTSGVTFKVLAHGSNTAETLYVYDSAALTSLTNPITTANFASATVCNDRVAFRVDPTDTTDDRYVDVIVVDTAGGYTAFIEHFDKYQHTIVIDERPNVIHHGMIWFGASTTSEVNTGIAWQVNTFIQDVRVEVVTVASAISIDVGLGPSASTGGATAGFRANVLLTAAGYVDDTAVITAGASVDYYPATTYGTLLYTAITGGGAATTDNGGKTWLGYAYSSATTTPYLIYQMNSTTGAGYLHYWFTRMR